MNTRARYASESRRDYALRTIKDKIIRLELKPGSMVSENELATELGLSRGPVREALLELSKVKIVEIYPQRGSFIAPIDYNLIEEACFLRETLEIAVAERCCNMGLSPEILAALRENVKLQQFYLENSNRDKLSDLDDEFHSMLFLNAGAKNIHSLISGMFVHFDRLRAMTITALKDIKFVDEHELILKTIVERDCESAKSLMHAHLTRYKVEKEEIREHYPEYLE